MDMLLRNTTMDELARMFARHRDRSPAPYLKRPETVARARRLAKKNGAWGELGRTFDPNRDIPAVRRSRTGATVAWDCARTPAPTGERSRELHRAALALWLGIQGRPRLPTGPALACCDEWTWVGAAHEGLAIDLSAVAVAAGCAELLHVFGDRIEDEVKARVSEEIDAGSSGTSGPTTGRTGGRPAATTGTTCATGRSSARRSTDREPTVLAHMVMPPSRT